MIEGPPKRLVLRIPIQKTPTLEAIQEVFSSEERGSIMSLADRQKVVIHSHKDP